MPTMRALFVSATLLAWAMPAVLAQPGTVLAEQKISSTEGSLGGPLDDGDRFGSSVAPIGDLDGDGIVDLAVGASRDDDGGFERGAVYVLFMNADGTVRAEQKISDADGGSLSNGDAFGESVAGLGDLDGDGVPDLAVGAPGDNTGIGINRGAVYILFMNADGTVHNRTKIADSVGGTLSNLDDFGAGVAGLGDLDGDGVVDLAVGAPGDDDYGNGGANLGAVYILFLNANGTERARQKLSNSEGGLEGVLGSGDRFGWSVATLGDLDGDGVVDLAVGAVRDDDGGGSGVADRGAAYVLFLNTDGTVRANQKISSTQGGLSGPLDDSDWFGTAVAGLGDLDRDGVPDLAVGARRDDDGGGARGAVYVLFLNTDGTVRAEQKISDTQGGLTAPLGDTDRFGAAAAGLGDLNGDGLEDLAVGVPFDDDGGGDRGAVYILFLDGGTTQPPFTLTASSDTTSYAQGSSAAFTYQVCNDTTASASGVVYYEAFTPGGTRVAGPVQVQSGALAGGACTPTLGFSVAIPATALPGDYDVVVSAGESLGGAAVAEAIVRVTVTAAPGRLASEQEDAAWALLAADPWAVEDASVLAASQAGVPDALALHGAYPNPVRGTARVAFSVPEAASVRLAIYDVLGREVAVLLDGALAAGRYEAALSADRLASGTYVVRLSAGSAVATARLSVVR